MADIFVGGTFRPGGPFPFTEDTDNKGGVHVVADATARDAIIASRKKLMMLAVTQNDGKIWQLTQIGPDIWTEFTGGSDSIATWSAARRYFAFDDINGNDTNAGFSDVSLSAAGAVAKKTWAGLLAIIPRNGDGRKMTIVGRRKTGGAYYAEDISLFRFFNYTEITFGATDTIASAGAVAFAGDTNDKIAAGAQVPAAFNSAGYKFTKETTAVTGATAASPVVITHAGTMVFVTGEKISISGATDANDPNDPSAYINGQVLQVGTVLSPTTFQLANTDGTTFAPWVSGGTITRYKVTKADDTAAALGSEAATGRGLRIRGDVATTTVANRNLTRHVYSYSTDTIIPNTDIATVAAGDIWYLEEPGLALNSFTAGCFGSASSSVGAVVSAIRFYGIRTFTLVVESSAGGVEFGFCQCEEGDGIILGNSYQILIRPTITGIGTIGGTVREPTGGALTIENVQNLSVQSLFNAGTANLTNVALYRFSGQCIFGALNLNLCGTREPAFATSRNIENCRQITSALRFRGSSGAVRNWQRDNSSVGGGAIQLDGMVGQAISLEKIFDYRTSVAGSAGLAMECQASDIIFVGRTVYLRGAVDSIGVGGHTNAEIMSGLVFEPQFMWRTRDLEFSDIKDVRGNHVALALTSPPSSTPGPVQIDIPGYAISDGSDAIERWGVIKPVGADFEVAPALADTLANASGTLQVSLNALTATAGAYLAVANGGEVWVIVHDGVPIKGDILYLSQTVANQAQKTAPGVGTVQRRLGSVIRTHSAGGVDWALISWKPELMPIIV